MKCAQCGGTALIGAAQNGHIDCVKLLVDAGANTKSMNLVRARGYDSVDCAVAHSLVMQYERLARHKSVFLFQHVQYVHVF